MEYVGNEIADLEEMKVRLERLREFLAVNEPPGSTSSPDLWFDYLLRTKAILGNFNNGLSLVACLLAKRYLAERFSMPPSDVALKSQNANGLDIDEMTNSGERIIGEIKTTSPLDPARFGAQQEKSFRRDFHKLRSQVADHKFMFVTDPRALEVIQRRHLAESEGVHVVCLWPVGETSDHD